MSNTKHTPGPLTVVSKFENDFFGEVMVIDANCDLVCRMPDNWSIWNSEKNHEAAKYERERAEADAKLITAAPEMLEALKELQSFHPTALPMAAFKIIETAIKKASPLPSLIFVSTIRPLGGKVLFVGIQVILFCI